MIFFYSGWGLLAPLFGVLGFAAALATATILGGPHSDDMLSVGAVVGGVIAAGLSWWLGSKVNHPSKGEIVIDRKTGQQRVRRRSNSFMFIPMQYYAAIYAVIFGFFAISLATSRQQQLSPAQRHSANDRPGGIAAALASLLEAAQAANGRAVLTWQFSEDKSALNDQVTPKAESQVTFSDGVLVQVAATCDTASVDFEFATFRGKDGLPFAEKGDTMGLRMRFNESTDRIATAALEYTNAATILFYDPQAAQQAVRGMVPRSDDSRQDKVYGFVQGLVGSLGMAQIQASAAGTIADLTGASSIRVELPLADGSANVVELNPQDASLRQLIQRCVRVSTPDNGTAAPSATTAGQSAAFQQGLADRKIWETWVNGISGAFREGALFWAAHRSDRTPPSCNDDQGREDNAFSQGCLRARNYLAKADTKRNSDLEYRRGWNSY